MHSVQFHGGPNWGCKGGSAPPRKIQSYNTFQMWNWRVKSIKKLVCCFFLLVLFEGEINNYLQGNWTVCETLKYSRIQMIWIYSSNFAAPPPRSSSRGGDRKKFRAYLPPRPLPRFISVYFLGLTVQRYVMVASNKQEFQCKSHINIRLNEKSKLLKNSMFENNSLNLEWIDWDFVHNNNT